MIPCHFRKGLSCASTMFCTQAQRGLAHVDVLCGWLKRSEHCCQGQPGIGDQGVSIRYRSIRFRRTIISLSIQLQGQLNIGSGAGVSAGHLIFGWGNCGDNFFCLTTIQSTFRIDLQAEDPEKCNGNGRRDSLNNGRQHRKFLPTMALGSIVQAW